MRLFGGKKQEVFDGILGVDLGPSGAKIVELVEEKGRMRLSTYGYSEFAEASGTPFAFFDDAERSLEVIRRIQKDAGMRATRAVAALPSGSVFQAVIVVPVPKDDKEDMKRSIETQAAKLLPMPLSEMILDSHVLDKDLLPKKDLAKKPATPEAASAVPATNEAAEQSSKHIRVLITGAPKALVQQYVDFFRRAKLELVSLETDVFALIRSLVGKDRSRIMLVDIGLVQTHIAIVDNGIPQLTRNMKGGGAMVTEALAAQMGMSFADAERMKRDLGFAKGATEPPMAVQRALENLVHELRYTLELYAGQDARNAATVEKIVLTGGSALLPMLDTYLTAQLNMNVYVGDPWARIAAPPTLRPVLDAVGPAFAVAIGLGMRMNES